MIISKLEIVDEQEDFVLTLDNYCSKKVVYYYDKDSADKLFCIVEYDNTKPKSRITYEDRLNENEK